MEKNKMKTKGFTLVELLVVMSIIAILAVIAISAFRTTQARSRDAQRKSDLKEITQALEMFYSDHKLYPASVDATGQIIACGLVAGKYGRCDWGTGQMTDGQTVYFRKLPEDPISSQTYFYRSLKNQQAYQIYAHLENKEDRNCLEPDCKTANPDLPINPESCGSGTICNFAISSPNVTPLDD